MPVIARSLVNYSQTISGQTIPPNGQRTYAGPTAALTTAAGNKTVSLVTIDDPSAAGPNADDEGLSGKAYHQVPVNGDTYVVPDDAEAVHLHPAGTIAGMTVTMPLNPYDGQEVSLSAGATVTALTMNATAQTLNGGLTAIGASTFGRWRYRAANTTWYRVG